MKIKIIEKGWEGYNGPLGTIHFENGVSTNPFSHAEGLRIGANIQVVEVDDEGNELGGVGLGHEFQTIVKMGIETIPLLPTDAERAASAVLEPIVEEETKPVIEGDAKVHTREELEAIADAKGIKGLREIADPLGAKSNSIPALIDAIIEAQA